MENPIATITMEDGSTMRFELYLQVAPNTVANFAKLANDGFYDRMEFFRVVPGVLVQSGCPENNGTGHADHMIKGEFSANGVENDISHTRGVISMARLSGDENFDTASSQFFIMQGNYPEYDGHYAAFGAAMDGESLEVLDKIANRAVDAYNVPIARQRIATIRVNTHNWVLEPATIPFPEEAEEEENTKK
ncbi:MAG: peptidylprolyl isomerase [Clostridia bacterium]|nr:peptidylprolyl isomerase [Clostridia bacterium]